MYLLDNCYENLVRRAGLIQKQADIASEVAKINQLIGKFQGSLDLMKKSSQAIRDFRSYLEQNRVTQTNIDPIRNYNFFNRRSPNGGFGYSNLRFEGDDFYGNFGYSISKWFRDTAPQGASISSILEPLYEQLEELSKRNDCSLSFTVRNEAEEEFEDQLSILSLHDPSLWLSLKDSDWDQVLRVLATAEHSVVVLDYLLQTKSLLSRLGNRVRYLLNTGRTKTEHILAIDHSGHLKIITSESIDEDLKLDLAHYATWSKRREGSINQVLKDNEFRIHETDHDSELDRDYMLSRVCTIHGGYKEARYSA